MEVEEEEWEIENNKNNKTIKIMKNWMGINCNLWKQFKNKCLLVYPPQQTFKQISSWVSHIKKMSYTQEMHILIHMEEVKEEMEGKESEVESTDRLKIIVYSLHLSS